MSFGVNALYEKGDRYGGPGVSVHGVQHRLRQADRLARAVDLDMVAAGWGPTVNNYLGRVTKPRILEAVREAEGLRVEDCELLLDGDRQVLRGLVLLAGETELIRRCEALGVSQGRTTLVEGLQQPFRDAAPAPAFYGSCSRGPA